MMSNYQAIQYELDQCTPQQAQQEVRQLFDDNAYTDDEGLFNQIASVSIIPSITFNQSWNLETNL